MVQGWNSKENISWKNTIRSLFMNKWLWKPRAWKRQKIQKEKRGRSRMVSLVIEILGGLDREGKQVREAEKEQPERKEEP